MAKPYVIGIDMGGTNTAFGIVDARGNVIASDSIKTGKHSNFDDYVDELYEALPGYSKKYIINHKNGFNITISLDAPVNPNDSTDKTTYQDFYDSTHCNESFVNNLIKDEVYAFLYENLNRLDEMSQKIVFFRFGMNGNPRLKEKEIGKLLEISTQSVSRITRDAIIKLRAMMTMPESAA